MMRLKILEVAEEIGFQKGEEKGFQKGEEIGFQKGGEKGFQEGAKKGEEKGKTQQLVRMIDVKLAKGKSREQIIDELELDGEGIVVLDRIDEFRERAHDSETRAVRHDAV
jgi:hypothetical protein